jgi:signal transduction histidine kinase
VVEGIDSTLLLLRAKLRDMTVERLYADDLPLIGARGGELNQVWTNLIDNAVDATGGTGRLVIRAQRRATVSSSRWRTTAPASRPVLLIGSSTRSSRPRRQVREPAWDSTSVTPSSASTAGISV